MKTVNFITSALTSGHGVRGVGFYTKRLLEPLKIQASKFDIKIIEDSKIDCDLVHYPFFDLFSNSLPVIRSTKTVVTIHDVIPLEFPEHYPAGIKGSLNLQLQKLALQTVDRVITDSYASVNSIHKYLGVPHNKLKLVYLAPDKVFKKIAKPKNKFNLPKKFVLYVGDINYNKNIPNLIAACKEAGIPLVMVGKNLTGVENLDLDHPELQHLQGVDLTIVTRLGYVSNEDLVDVYNLATVYCQPSLSEGFGLPVLEALACGAAVACSNTSSLPELAGDCATYFNPHNVSEMASALTSAKPVIAVTQLAKFSWEKTADLTLNVYQDVLA